MPHPEAGWGTGIRTPIDGSKDRSPAIRRSPISSLIATCKVRSRTDPIPWPDTTYHRKTPIAELSSGAEAQT